MLRSYSSVAPAVAGFAAMGAIALGTLSTSVCGQGGDDSTTATPIPGCPYADIGTTVGYTDDADEICPFVGSTSPDVWYRYTADADQQLTIDLCYSRYDTKVYVYDSLFNLASTRGGLPACNDDFCSSPDGGLGRSFLEGVCVFAPNTYFVVVDGYSGDQGEYDIIVICDDAVDCAQPVIVDCPAGATIEPDDCAFGNLAPNDLVNGGCNSTPPSFTSIACGEVVCGTGYFDSAFRDTDWWLMNVCCAPSGTVFHVTGEAEFEAVYGRVQNFGVHDCTGVSTFAEFVLVEKGTPFNYVTPELDPGIYWFFVGCDFSEIVNCNQPLGGPPNEIGDGYTLRIDCSPDPGPCAVANAVCATAHPVALGTTSFTLECSGVDGPVHPCGAASPCAGADDLIRNDVWYEYSAPFGGNLTVAATGGIGGLAVAVYAGDCPASGGALCALSATGAPVEVVVPVDPGSYFIRVGSRTGAGGTGTLALALDAAPACPPAGGSGVSFAPSLNYLVAGDADDCGWSWSLTPLTKTRMKVLSDLDVPGVAPPGTAFDVATAFAASINAAAAAAGCGTAQLDAKVVTIAGNVHLSIRPGRKEMTSAISHLDLRVGPAGCPATCLAKPGLPACSFNPTIEGATLSGQDCNDNGWDDTIDIASGDSLDENGDGIPDECACAGDVGGDGEVGFSDLLAILSVWGLCPGCPEDVDVDGVVGFGDLLAVLATWGPCE